MATLNSIGQRLLAGIISARRADERLERQSAHAERVNVVGAGGALTAAYEQLRNAAENTEEHLLLQNAIRRFYRQLFLTRDGELVRTSGGELAIELTFAGYVANASLTKAQVDQISAIAVTHYRVYEQLQQRRDIRVDAPLTWVLDSLSLATAGIVNSREFEDAFVDFASVYLETIVTPDTLKRRHKQKLGDDFGAGLFVAIHKALLKSDVATIRASLLRRYGVAVDDVESFVQFNQRIEALLDSSYVDELYHQVDRQGAPLRVIRHMIETRPDFTDIVARREVFLEAFEQQVNKEYANILDRVNRAIVRSVMFLIITKFLVGIAVEVPYDLWSHGYILWQPLLINLLFPPIYMVALRLTLTLPGYANTAALVDRIDTMLYGAGTVLVKRRSANRRYSAVFSSLYVVFSLIVFGAVMWLLLMLGFSLVHMAIFFVFVSAASFLGFRLSRLVRELEIVRSSSNGLTMIRDFVYLPFVIVGRWMSDKYSKLNIVTLVLDMLIELPLKTILRLVRQWGAFIDDRKDRL